MAAPCNTPLRGASRCLRQSKAPGFDPHKPSGGLQTVRLLSLGWRPGETGSAGPNCLQRRLLHRHTLGQIARLIHISAERYGYMVGEQLHRYSHQQGV